MGKQKNSLPNISKAEHDVLRVLWKDGVQSVREVHDEVTKATGWAYTTTKTVMDRMVAKGHLQRENYHGVFIYKPMITKSEGLAKMVRFFTQRVLEMDQLSVVAMLQGSGALSPTEVDELTRLVAEEDDRKGKKS